MVHLSGKDELFILWLQICFRLSEINGAASFKSLGPVLFEPVALLISIFLRYFSVKYVVQKSNYFQGFSHHKTASAYQN